MSLLFIQQWIPEPVVRAFCWALIHSIWQGVAIAILAGLIILFTKKAAASLRYNLLSGCLTVFVISSVITFVYELNTGNYGSGHDAFQQAANSFAITEVEDRQASIQTRGGTENFFGYFSTYLNEHASLIVLTWFLFFFVKSIQLASGLYYIQRLRHERNREVPHEWIERLHQLSKSVGINQQISFLQSGLVQMPVVIGILKPVILIPFGLLTQLSAVQVEAILIHELAHIKRKDFLVNLIQSFTEAVYFFNPAILWLSSLIREEREACCDDIVVTNMPHKKSYLEALVSFQDESFISAGHAMALGGKKNYLLKRVQRMLTHENKKLNIMEKSILFVGLVGITAFSFIPSNEEKLRQTTIELITEQVNRIPTHPTLPATPSQPVLLVKQTIAKKVKPSLNQVPLTIIDTVPKSKSKEIILFPSISSNVNDDGNKKTVDIDATDNSGKKYRIKKIDNEITELRVNGELIAKENYDDHAVALKSIGEYMGIGTTSRSKFNNVSRYRFNEEQKQKMIERNKKREVDNDKMKKEFDEKRKVKLNEIQRNNEIRNKKLIHRNNETITRFRVEDSARNFKKINRANFANNSLQRTTGEVSGIIMELERAGVIKDKENVSFNFNKNELVVNGSKQSAQLHELLKQKYLHKAGDYINYKKNGNTTSTTINRE
ncbi:MAG: M56 family metallopeptidase [Flavisolibacter sp.]